MRCKAILFDLDGVLVDSAQCVENTWKQWAVGHGLDPSRIMAIAHGRRTVETVPMIAPHLDVAEEVAALAAIESNTTDGVYEVPGARALVERLPAEAWAVVTSGHRSIATLRISHVGLLMPPVLVCADDITHGKPHPEGYLTAAERLGRAPSECVVIEDAPAGIDAARAAGMRSIAIAGTFGRDTLAAADLIVSGLASLRVVTDGTWIAISELAA